MESTHNVNAPSEADDVEGHGLLTNAAIAGALTVGGTIAMAAPAAADGVVVAACQEGQAYNATTAACEDVCEAGEIYNTTTHTCDDVSCADGHVYNVDSGACESAEYASQEVSDTADDPYASAQRVVCETPLEIPATVLDKIGYYAETPAPRVSNTIATAVCNRLNYLDPILGTTLTVDDVIRVIDEAAPAALVESGSDEEIATYLWHNAHDLIMEFAVSR